VIHVQWFMKPVLGFWAYCRRCVGRLYLTGGGRCFSCRNCYDLSYESRNEIRSGMFGAYGGVLRTERQIEGLRSQIKRRTWRGRLPHPWVLSRRCRFRRSACLEGFAGGVGAMWASKCVEIEPPFVVLLTIWSAGTPIMKLNRKAQVIEL